MRFNRNLGPAILLGLLVLYALTNRYWLPDSAAQYIRALIK
jgi:hypothetical protein